MIRIVVLRALVVIRDSSDTSISYDSAVVVVYQSGFEAGL